MARLLRESWWLLGAATFLYLALTLVPYTKSDPGWPFSGTGAPIGNRGGVIGAWLSDLLLYLLPFLAVGFLWLRAFMAKRHKKSL